MSDPAAALPSSTSRAIVGQLLHHAWPVLIAQLLSMSMMVADTVIAGRYGTEDLAGVAIGSSYYISVVMLLTGTLQAVAPTIAHHVGARRQEAIAPALHQGFWLALLLAVPGVALLLSPGWLTLYSGIAGGADIILLPEMPYDIDRVCDAVERRAKKGSNFSIIAVAEGAMNVDEAKLKRKEWTAKRAEAGYTTATNRIAAAVQKKTGMETRVCIPGHMQRGGSPSAYDRVLATQFGSYAAKLVEIEQYGVTVALVNNHVISNRLEDIAGKTRNIPEGCELLTVAKRMGISLG